MRGGGVEGLHARYKGVEEEAHLIPIYFINLDNRPDRREFMERQFSALGLTANRLAAISNPVRQVQPDGLKRGELACLESHEALWWVSVRESRPILVLEDDALLSPELPAFLQSLGDDLPTDVHVLRLETWFTSVRMGAPVSVGGRQVRRLLQQTCGSAGYIVTPLAALNYLGFSRPGSRPVDVTLFFPPAINHLQVMQADPALVAPLDRLPEQPNSELAHSTLKLETVAKSGRQNATLARLADYRTILDFEPREWRHLKRKPLPFAGDWREALSASAPAEPS